jgi:hypothetical protein
MSVTLKNKRLSKGQRKHIRRLKQAARKEGSTYHPPNTDRTPKKPDGE